MRNRKLDLAMSANEVINSMKTLLREEAKQRETLAGILHDKKSDLTALDFILQKHAFDFKRGVFQINDLQKDREYLDEFLTDFRKITYGIYPKLLEILGLFNSIDQYTNDAREKHGIEIKTSSFNTVKLDVPKLIEAEIYRVYTEVFDYVCKPLPRKIEINLSYDEGYLCFEFQRSKTKKLKKQDPEGIKRLSVIKARLVYLEASVSEQTNWDDFIKIGFSLA